MKQLVLVYNGSSGSALPVPQLRKLCKAAGFEVVKSIKLDEHLARRLSPYLTRKSYIAAVGGDGTISAVAQHLVGTPAILVPIPGGTLNHFTKDLSIDQDIAGALRAARHATPYRVDIASVNDVYFINNSSIGLYPQSLQTRKQAESTLGKWPAAAYGVLRAFMRYRTYHVTIDNHAFDTPFVFVGNGEYQLTDMTAGGRQTLDAGMLSVYIIRSSSRLSLVRIFCRALIGNLRGENDFLHFTTRAITIDSRRRRISASHDGEVSKLSTPIAYKIHAASLWIIAPKN